MRRGGRAEWRKGGRLDLLVNNAGIMQKAGVEEISLAAWQRNIMVNLTPPLLMIQAMLPHLRGTSAHDHFALGIGIGQDDMGGLAALNDPIPGRRAIPSSAERDWPRWSRTAGAAAAWGVPRP